MRHYLFLALPVLLAFGCGPSAGLERISSDLSGQDPVLQVWCKAKRLETGADIKVLVGWNKWLGSAAVDPAAPHSDGTLVVNVPTWEPAKSDFDRSNEMRVEFIYNREVLARKVFKTPTDFANAFDRKLHPEREAPRPQPATDDRPKKASCGTCGENIPLDAGECPHCGMKVTK